MPIASTELSSDDVLEEVANFGDLQQDFSDFEETEADGPASTISFFEDEGNY
jgi:hypothetical protein